MIEFQRKPSLLGTAFAKIYAPYPSKTKLPSAYSPRGRLHTGDVYHTTDILTVNSH